MTEMDSWKLFFPVNEVYDILELTNQQQPEKTHALTHSELYEPFKSSVRYDDHLSSSSPRSYWSCEDGIYPASAIGRRFGIGVHRFQTILRPLTFGLVDDDDDQDKWKPVRHFVDSCNAAWQTTITPGYKLTVDENMFAWYGKGDRPGGMPEVIKIKRQKGSVAKRKPLLVSLSGIMIGIEINEGQVNMKTKSWQQAHRATTATTLRLTEPWTGSRRRFPAWIGENSSQSQKA